MSKQRTIEASALPRYFFKIKKTKKTKHNIVSFNSSLLARGLLLVLKSSSITAGTQVFLHRCWYSKKLRGLFLGANLETGEQLAKKIKRWRWM